MHISHVPLTECQVSYSMAYQTRHKDREQQRKANTGVGYNMLINLPPAECLTDTQIIEAKPMQPIKLLSISRVDQSAKSKSTKSDNVDYKRVDKWAVEALEMNMAGMDEKERENAFTYFNSDSYDNSVKKEDSSNKKEESSNNDNNSKDKPDKDNSGAKSEESKYNVVKVRSGLYNFGSLSRRFGTMLTENYLIKMIDDGESYDASDMYGDLLDIYNEFEFESSPRNGFVMKIRYPNSEQKDYPLVLVTQAKSKFKCYDWEILDFPNVKVVHFDHRFYSGSMGARARVFDQRGWIPQSRLDLVCKIKQFDINAPVREWCLPKTSNMIGRHAYKLLFERVVIENKVTICVCLF